ncbi:hypothetical protein CCZ01_02745 [Helicobacter monodelphidis]|uniref:tRNA1(Val) (adenine(37)-N6)-methyltransferase n=1 Tax=Helicobacter sp. 15-1451 TaxID=2004995 RepID=UPI000DCE9636|nr:methyltransferase [Helicobacter sp. 15-1451]RAX58352.1 hypothetical protein CCZ01_02745 [Helicobacter sp. 15-1451]
MCENRPYRLLQIAQPAKGYAYNSDSLFLYAFSIPHIPNHSQVLEIGAGCGVIGLLCARDKPLKLTMVEKIEEMVFYAQRNQRVGGFDVEIIHSDFLELTPKSMNSFDVAISNPPFYHSHHLKSPNLLTYNARFEENLPFEKLLKHLKRFLKPKGLFLFCFDARECERILYLLRQEHFKVEELRFVYPNCFKDANLLLCKARLNSKATLSILPPLFVYEHGDFSQEVQKIFKQANTHSIKAEK